MSEPIPFAELLARVRAGDADAAAELVKQYESAIRVAARARLVDPALRRHFDSLDVCQSVLGSFFVRAAAGQFDLAEPTQLVALLSKMTRNKLAMRARRHRAAKRDGRRVVEGDAALDDAAARQPGPSSVASARELYAAVMGRLSSDEREIARRRGEGQDWAEIAAALGGTAEARRKQLARAITRVGADLGLEESGDAD